MYILFSHTPCTYVFILINNTLCNIRCGFRAVNYGGIGLIVGHELTHGFDSSGEWFISVSHKFDIKYYGDK